MGAGSCCTLENLPLWPFVYVRKEKDIVPRQGLYPFLLNVMLSETNDFLCSLLVFVLRFGVRQGVFSFDLVWPLIHFSVGVTPKGDRVFKVRLFPISLSFAPGNVHAMLFPVFLFVRW